MDFALSLRELAPSIVSWPAVPGHGTMVTSRWDTGLFVIIKVGGGEERMTDLIHFSRAWTLKERIVVLFWMSFQKMKPMWRLRSGVKEGGPSRLGSFLVKTDLKLFEGYKVIRQREKWGPHPSRRIKIVKWIKSKMDEVWKARRVVALRFGVVLRILWRVN